MTVLDVTVLEMALLHVTVLDLSVLHVTILDLTIVNIAGVVARVHRDEPHAGHLKTLQGLLPGCQGQNLAVTVLYVTVLDLTVLDATVLYVPRSQESSHEYNETHPEPVVTPAYMKEAIIDHLGILPPEMVKKTRNPKPETRNPKPETLDPWPQTLDSEPWTLTINPQAKQRNNLGFAVHDSGLRVSWPASLSPQIALRAEVFQLICVSMCLVHRN